jgi:hypothetical protein
MQNVDSRPSRAVNIPEEILDKIGIVARSKGTTIRGFIIDVLEEHIEKVYPNLDRVMKELTGE